MVLTNDDGGTLIQTDVGCMWLARVADPGCASEACP
jgi:hypothetical protein